MAAAGCRLEALLWVEIGNLPSSNDWQKILQSLFEGRFLPACRRPPSRVQEHGTLLPCQSRPRQAVGKPQSAHCLNSRPIWKPLMDVAASCVTSTRSTGGVHGQLARTIQCGHPHAYRIEPFVLPWSPHVPAQFVQETTGRKLMKSAGAYPSRTNGHGAVHARPSLHLSVSSFVCPPHHRPLARQALSALQTNSPVQHDADSNNFFTGCSRVFRRSMNNLRTRQLQGTCC